MKEKKIVAIVQARTGSTRLPGKVFLPLCGRPLIWHVFNRLSNAHLLDDCILATTVNPGDDALQQWAEENKFRFFRGSEDDVLARYYHAAVETGADVVVRITADDPFKDPGIIDEVVQFFLDNQLDFASNNNPPSYPEGLDVEVFTMAALELAQKNAADPFEREHVTQYFYRNPSLFKQANYPYTEDISYLRWTLDTEEDYKMAKLVYDQLCRPDQIFLFKQILDLLQQQPEIATINSGVKRSAMYS